MSTAKSVLAQIVSHWEAQGWSTEDLSTFRMEIDPNALTLTDDPPIVLANTPPPAAPVLPIFSAEDLAKVRKEEKDKLYPRIEEMQAELKALREEQAARAAAEQAAQDEAAALAKAAAEAEMSAKELIQAKEQEWTAKFSELEAARERDAALLDMERRFAGLQAYRSQRMEESADEIMPELRDLVSGDSEEAIEASIAAMIARTNTIMANITQGQQQARAQQRGVTPTAPATGPGDTDPLNQTITADDIKNMSMPEYAKHRDRLMAASKNNSRGLFS